MLVCFPKHLLADSLQFTYRFKHFYLFSYFAIDLNLVMAQMINLTLYLYFTIITGRSIFKFDAFANQKEFYFE